MISIAGADLMGGQTSAIAWGRVGAQPSSHSPMPLTDEVARTLAGLALATALLGLAWLALANPQRSLKRGLKGAWRTLALSVG